MTEQPIDQWFMREVIPLEPMLTRFLQRNWRHEADIADLRQEAYARVYEAAQRERPLLVKPFLFQITRNLMIDRLRRQSVVSLESMTDFEWLNVSDNKPSSEAYVAARQELRLLQTALDALPPRCRQVVLMRKVEGLSQKEVAKRMGIAIETVENQVAKGMRLLAQALGDRRGAVTTEARRYNFFRKPRDVR
ncbi:MAG TPA: RNA polymerase sigma factor [Rhizomicrobium sp.]|jgi:RNA polymerase sigma factor (sigma-70 family)|nr:RNA polymerase sigma factor [Rhizomicrobium sp.]